MKILPLILAVFLGSTAFAQTQSFTNIKVSGTVTFTNPLPVAQGGTGLATLAANSIVYGNGTGNLIALPSQINRLYGTDGSGSPTMLLTIPSQVQANITAVSPSADLLVHSISSGVAGIGNSGDFSGKHFVPTTDNGSGFQIGAQTFRFNLGFFGQGGIVIGGDGSSNNGTTITATGTAPNETLVLQGHGTGTLTLGKLTSSTTNGVVYATASGVAITGTGTAGQVLTSNGSGSPPTFQAGGGGGGGVTSVGMTVPTFLSVTPATITTSGTFAVSLSGTALPVSNGGTGNTTFGTGQIPYGNGTGALGKTANATLDASGNLFANGNITTNGDLTFAATHGVTGGASTSLTVGYSGYKSGVGLNSGSAISLTTNTPTDVVSHLFPAGHWLIWGNVWFSQGAGTSTTFYVGGISTTSGSLPGVDSARETQTAAPITSTGVAGNISITPYSFDITTPTTYYLVSAAVFSGGTLSTFGGMSWLQTP